MLGRAVSWAQARLSSVMSPMMWLPSVFPRASDGIREFNEPAVPAQVSMMTNNFRWEDLAVDGGQPVRKTGFAPWPSFAADEVEAASRVLRSGKVNYWTGEEGRKFEIEFAEQA